MKIRIGRPWGYLDTLVGDVMSGLVVVSSRYSYGHSGGASIACASPHSSVVWGYGTNITVTREFHRESGVPWCVTSYMVSLECKLKTIEGTGAFVSVEKYIG